MLSKNAALELAPHSIRVNLVLPGLIETPTDEFDSPLDRRAES